MIIAFTGTQRGMTPAQRDAVRALLAHRPTCVVHGGCIGADAEFDAIARAECSFDTTIVVWPSNILAKSAVLTRDARTLVMPSMSPLVRNRNIVSGADIVIACPKRDREELRSGTWATVRAARRFKRRIGIVWPHGVTEFEGPIT